MDPLVKKGQVEHAVRPVKYKIFAQNRKENMRNEFEPSQVYTEGAVEMS